MFFRTLLGIIPLLLLGPLSFAVTVNSQSVVISPDGRSISLGISNYRKQDYFCKQIDLELEFVSANYSQNLGVLNLTLVDQYVPAESSIQYEELDSHYIAEFRAHNPTAIVNRVYRNASCKPASFADYCTYAKKSVEEERTIEEMMDWAYEFRCDRLEKDIGRTLKLINRNIVSLKPISFLKNLTYLSLYNNQVEDLHWLSELDSLQKVIVSKNPVKSISDITNLPEMRYIYANSTLVEQLDHSKKGPKLKAVYLNNTPYVSRQK
jgi:hypothetical protein